ncbi:hypothetical protein [uncultured Draconibacterium sp.]|uniref:hypothetical protein n=1 Tax=uncultured Draconibacterium sp. TaxID=1573823 RepID=UPI002AA7BD25|nr:hypothetical protein [uncultured Draconibacterium sp.]
MAKMNESGKRDFVSQMITILQQNSTLLTDSGFDPTAKITQLDTELTAADDAEGRQIEAKAAAKIATREAQQTLKTAYDDGSATVEIIAGFLGKDHPLVQELRKLRKSNGNAVTPPAMPQ